MACSADHPCGAPALRACVSLPVSRTAARSAIRTRVEPEGSSTLPLLVIKKGRQRRPFSIIGGEGGIRTLDGL